MSLEEIIRMAREAGFSVTWPETEPNFERFAALVAAAEREACAKACEAAYEACWQENETVQAAGAQRCWAAIRARGQE